MWLGLIRESGIETPATLLFKIYNESSYLHCICLSSMRQFTTTTTQRNQVTIPAEVRRILGINPRDKVSFTVNDDGHVSIAAAEFTLKTAYGSVKPITDGRNLDEIVRDVKDEKAEQTAGELRKP